MAWSPPALNAGIVWVSAPGDYATFNSNHTPDGTYFLVRQRALASASGIASRGRPRSDGRLAHSTSPKMTREPERVFEARGGRLAGRPDHFDGHTLTEYKSALPDPTWPGARELLDSFRRQIRLYAAIIADAAGTWPTHARVVAASGQVLEVEINPAACDAEADAALAALDRLNSEVVSEALPERLAQPSPSACTGCPFQTICPAFWRQLDNGAMQGLSYAAIEGVLEWLETTHNGDLYTAHLALASTSHDLNHQQPLVLRKSAQRDLTALAAGTRWRIVSAKIRPDGRLRADLSTVVCSVSSLPALETARTNPRHPSSSPRLFRV
jgi:PD-(D/E)XK nuclease superfamily